MVLVGQYPTVAHREVAEAIVQFSIEHPVEAVLLVNSCARGVAIPESDLDIALLAGPADRTAVEEAWNRHHRANPALRLHLDVFDGQWTPEIWDDGGGPDAFEIEIGNRVAHALPLWERATAFRDLQARWLPYYAEPLRDARLRMVTQACKTDLDRVESGVGRGLYFYAFDRLYHAFQEFLQAVFISRRVYPIAYNKWIREQVTEWLGLPELYAELLTILQIGSLESNDLLDKARTLRRLLNKWAES